MSKQVNSVNIEPEICMETGLPTGSIMKYNFFVNPFTSCKLTLSFVTIHYHAGHTYAMQELVKEVTLINHSNNGFCMELIKLSP